MVSVTAWRRLVVAASSQTVVPRAVSACPLKAWRSFRVRMSHNTTQPELARLKKRREFLAVAGANRKWATPGMVVQVRKRPSGEDGEDVVRIGFTTSRKVGNAVIRNRARRRLRACVDAVLPGRVKTGLDIVVIGRAATPDRSFEALKGDFVKSLKKLNAFTEPSAEPAGQGINHA